MNSRPQLYLASDLLGAHPIEIHLSLGLRLWQVVRGDKDGEFAWELTVFQVSPQIVYLRTHNLGEWHARLRLTATNWGEAFAELNALLAPSGHTLGDAVFISHDERTQHYLIGIA